MKSLYRDKWFPNEIYIRANRCMLNGKYARKIGLTIELSPSFGVLFIDYLRAFVPAGRLIFKYRHQVFLVRIYARRANYSTRLFDRMNDDLCRMWWNHVDTDWNWIVNRLLVRRCDSVFRVSLGRHSWLEWTCDTIRWTSVIEFFLFFFCFFVFFLKWCKR